jgi:hypothetical protein
MPRMLRVAVAAGLFALAIASPALAQLDANLGALTPDNVKGYLAPLPKALSTTLNMAEFQSASIPLAGFNFTVGIHAMGVTFADKDRTYSPKDPAGFTSTAPVAAPTVIGDVNAVTQPGQGGTSLYHPGGFDISQFVIAVPQLTVGSVMGTKAVVRWIQADAGDSEIGHVRFFGLGVQHSLNRYIKGLPCDLAAGGMYQTFKLGDNDLVDTKAIHFEVTASRKVAMFVQPYAAVGFDTFSMEANYDQEINGTTVGTNVKFDDENSFHGTLGVQLGFPFVKLNAQVDQAKETGAAIGLRFGIGN